MADRTLPGTGESSGTIGGGTAGDPSARPRVTRQLRALRFDAGSLALNLTCTLGRRGGRPIERLAGPAELAHWLVGVGLAMPSDVSPDTLLGRLRPLREALYEVLRAVADERSPQREDLEVVNVHAGTGLGAPRLVWSDADSPGPLVEQPGADTVDGLLALIARDGIAHVGEADRRSRLCVCSAADCQMLYLATRGRAARNWCSMRHCGNRAKAATYRTRRPGAGPHE